MGRPPERVCVQGSGPSGGQSCKCPDAWGNQLWAPGHCVGGPPPTPMAGAEAALPSGLVHPARPRPVTIECLLGPAARWLLSTCLIPGPASGAGDSRIRAPQPAQGSSRPGSSAHVSPAHPPALPFFHQVWEALSRRAVHPGASTAVLQVRPCPCRCPSPALPQPRARLSLPTPPGGAPPRTQLPVPTTARPPCRGQHRGPRPLLSHYVTPETSPSL